MRTPWIEMYCYLAVGGPEKNQKPGGRDFRPSLEDALPVASVPRGCWLRRSSLKLLSFADLHLRKHKLRLPSASATAPWITHYRWQGTLPSITAPLLSHYTTLGPFRSSLPRASVLRRGDPRPVLEHSLKKKIKT